MLTTQQEMAQTKIIPNTNTNEHNTHTGTKEDVTHTDTKGDNTYNDSKLKAAHNHSLEHTCIYTVELPTSEHWRPEVKVAKKE